jgi:hypothetical protein
MYQDTRTFRRFYVGTSSTLSCVGVVFINGAFVENSLLSWQQPGLFVDFSGTPLASNSIGYNMVLELEALCDRNGQLGLSPMLFRNFIKINFIYFRRFPLY